MPKYFIFPIFTAVFALILIATVPKREIRRLSIYGIIFGGMIDVLVHIFGHVTGLYSWINYGPFAFMGISIFADVSWAMFFILYFYFLPKRKPLNYIYVGVAVFFSILYYNLSIDLGIFKAFDRILFPFIGFAVWFSVATWGYYKLIVYMEAGQPQKNRNLIRLRLSPQPARKIEKKIQKKNKVLKLKIKRHI